MTGEAWQHFRKVTARTVHETRRALGLSQVQVAARAQVSQGAVSRLEAGAGDGLPVTTVVNVLLALAAAAEAQTLPLGASAQQLFDFSRVFLKPFQILAPPDPDLLALLRAYHRLDPTRRRALARLADAANDLFGRDFTRDNGSGTTTPQELP
jgi:transcriptional regulator with XRE-family HTH domain